MLNTQAKVVERKSTNHAFDCSIVFVDAATQQTYKNDTLQWLESDFEAEGQPFSHFWHNRSIITRAFEACTALVALNTQREVIGFMIWSDHTLSLEIDIVEVKKEYRRQGVFKTVQLELIKRFPKCVLFTASVIPEAVEAFRQDGWIEGEVQYSSKNTTKFIKKTQLTLEPSVSKPSIGNFIEVCSENFYAVKGKKEQYENEMTYFEIPKLSSGKLPQPIVMAFHYEWYIGLYRDGKLVVENKANYLFEEDYESDCFGFLILSGIKLKDKSLFPEYNEIEPKKEEEEDSAATVSLYSEEDVPTTQECNQEPGSNKELLTRVVDLSEYYDAEQQSSFEDQQDEGFAQPSVRFSQPNTKEDAQTDEEKTLRNVPKRRKQK